MGFIKDTAQTAVSRFALFLLVVFSSVVLARILGPSGKGVFALVVLVPSMLVMLGNLGIGSAGTYHLSSQPERAGRIIGTLYASAFGLSALLILVVGVLYWALGTSYFADIPPRYRYLPLLAIPGMLLVKYSSYALLGLKRTLGYNISRLLGNLFYFLSLVLLAFTFGDKIAGALLLWSLGHLLGGTVGMYLVWRRSRFPLGWDYAAFRNLLSFGFRSHLMLVLVFLNYRIDMFLVKYFSGLEQLGLYSVAVGGAEVLWEAFRPVATMLFVRTAGSRREEARSLTPLVCRSSLWLAVLMAAIMFLLGPVLIPFLYGEAFRGSVLPFQALLPGVTVFCVFNTLASDFLGRGRPGIPTRIALFSVALNLVLNLLFIPRWGIVGAALASDFAYGSAVLGILIQYRLSTRAGWRELLILSPSEVLQSVRRILTSLKTAAVDPLD